MIQGGGCWWGKWWLQKLYPLCLCPRGREKKNQEKTWVLMGLEASDYNLLVMVCMLENARRWLYNSLGSFGNVLVFGSRWVFLCSLMYVHCMLMYNGLQSRWSFRGSGVRQFVQQKVCFMKLIVSRKQKRKQFWFLFSCFPIAIYFAFYFVSFCLNSISFLYDLFVLLLRLSCITSLLEFQLIRDVLHLENVRSL